MPAPKSSKKPTIDMPSKEQLEMATRPYSDEELTLSPEQEQKMQKLMEFFDLYGIDYSKFKPEFLSFITNKRAYPNYDQYQYTPPHHDMKKWLMAVKNVHYKQKAGLPFQEAIKLSVQGWNKMEVYDFLNWLRFHEEGAHMKYKFAQVWYENGQPGYFLHVKPDAPKEPEPQTDGTAVDRASEEAERNEEKRSVIEKQRQKIIGRLDSAEKLLRSPEGQQFAGNELEQLMEAIYTLKKKVQLVNKLSVSTRLYEDMIVREGNVLKREGFAKAAEVLYSLAQTPAQAGESAQGTPGGATPTDTPPPPPPDGAGNPGAPGSLPAEPPGTPSVQTPVGGDQNKDQPPVDALPAEPPQPAGIKNFIERMNEGGVATDDTEAEDDQLEVFDSEDDMMVTEAQAAPPVGPGIPPAALEDVPMTDAPPADRNPPAFIPPKAEKPTGKEEEPLEVTEDELPPPGAAGDVGDTPSGGTGTSLDSKLDATFKNVTMQEIVAELEDIATHYKVREMPRRLARLDMMFSAKNISSYFPNLAEAQNRALEANNYIATRIDDILAKVRGAMATSDIASTLKTDQEKEKQRKQMRKDQENAELEGGAGKETPAVEMGELGAPPAAPAAPPAPAAPAPGPATRPLG